MQKVLPGILLIVCWQHKRTPGKKQKLEGKNVVGTKERWEGGEERWERGKKRWEGVGEAVWIRMSHGANVFVLHEFHGSFFHPGTSSTRSTLTVTVSPLSPCTTNATYGILIILHSITAAASLSLTRTHWHHPAQAMFLYDIINHTMSTL